MGDCNKFKIILILLTIKLNFACSDRQEQDELDDFQVLYLCFSYVYLICI